MQALAIKRKRMEEIQHVELNIPVPAGVSDVRSNTGLIRAEREDVTADEVLKFMKKKLDEVSGEPFEARPVTIFRLPAWVYENNKDLSEPKIVSIGPYHHGKESVRSMEENKWSTLRDFLARNKNVGIEVYHQEMRLLERQVRECYSETVNLESKDFVMMLLLDGCFILELLSKQKEGDWLAICSLNWSMEGLSSDLYLMENQIPFFVIHKLFEIQNVCSKNCDQGLCPLIMLIYEVMPWPVEFGFNELQMSCSEIQHLLHLCYTRVVPGNQLAGEQRDMVSDKSCLRGLQNFLWSKIFSKSSRPISQSSISKDIESSISEVPFMCATELQLAGVKFKRKKSPRHMFDITFQNGTMEIPNIRIQNVLNNYLWNMVFLEQSQRFKFDQILTSYVAVLSSLILTEKDVAILERSNIISNLLKNDEEAATFFNQFDECFFVLNYSKHYFHDLFMVVKEYSESNCHKYRAQLKRDYFSSPWSSISVVAATILLILTFLQTYYSAVR